MQTYIYVPVCHCHTVSTTSRNAIQQSRSRQGNYTVVSSFVKSPCRTWGEVLQASVSHLRQFVESITSPHACLLEACALNLEKE